MPVYNTRLRVHYIRNEVNVLPAIVQALHELDLGNIFHLNVFRSGKLTKGLLIARCINESHDKQIAEQVNNHTEKKISQYTRSKRWVRLRWNGRAHQ